MSDNEATPVPLRPGGYDLQNTSDGQAGTYGGYLPLFHFPGRTWTPAPIMVSGSLFADPNSSVWMVATPGWRCSPVIWPDGYTCPPEGLCAVFGPRCSGEKGSGQVDDMTAHGQSVPQQLTIVPPVAPPVIDPITGALIYRTQYPYVTGSLSVSLQGLALIKGTDYTELSPLLGTFEMITNQPQDNTADLTVRYHQATTVPTVGPEPGTLPTTEPGMTPPPPLPGSGVYRPANQRQFGWGTIYDAVNCNMACSAMLLDRHTLGRHSATIGSPQSTPPQHRFYSGVTAVTGTGHGDARHAWSVGWNESYLYPGAVSWAYFVTQIQSGRGATVFGLYAYMDAAYKKSPTFNGPHAVYINEQLSDGSFWGYDPIVNIPIVYPYSVIKTYADSYNNFKDRIEAGYSRVTPKF